MDINSKSHFLPSIGARIFLHIALVFVVFGSTYLIPRIATSNNPVEARELAPESQFSGVRGVLMSSTPRNIVTYGGEDFTEESLVLISLKNDFLLNRDGIDSSSSFSASLGAYTVSTRSGFVPLADRIDPLRPYQLYTVRPGDTIALIAKSHGVSQSTLLDNNSEVHVDEFLPVDFVLVIPLIDGILHKVAPGETLSSIVEMYDNTALNAIIAYKPNSLLDPSDLKVNQRILLPGAEFKPPPPPVARGRNDGRFRVFPVAQWVYVSDEFGAPRGGGRVHRGIDLALNTGTDIVSVCDGVVTRVEWWTYSYGYHVVVDCGSGWTALYAHLDNIYVYVGEPLVAGELIGPSGNTGFSTGPHLHFEIMYWGVALDPNDILAFY